MKRYILSHIRGSIELFCILVTSTVVWHLVAYGQPRFDGFDAIVLACVAIGVGFTRWPLFDSDEALLRVTPDSYKQ